MQRRKDVSRQSRTEDPLPGRMTLHSLSLPSLAAVVALTLATLACAFLESAVPIAPTAIATRTPLPTFTPTMPGTSLAMVMPEQPPAASPTPPTSTPAIAPTVAPFPQTSGWSFSSVRIYARQEDDSLQLHGNFINATGTSQELLFITGTFYDAQGQVIAGEESTYDYWSVPVIPPGGRMPFELTVEGIQSAADFDLRVEAQPSNENPRQDFEFLNLYEDAAEGLYCIGGTLRNPGDRLQDYLLIVAILYDSQDRVINFNDRYADPEYAAGDDPQDFEVCVDTLSQEVTRYELQAWGQ